MIRNSTHIFLIDFLKTNTSGAAHVTYHVSNPEVPPCVSHVNTSLSHSGVIANENVCFGSLFGSFCAKPAAMSHEVCSLKAQLEEKEREISALRNKLSHLEKV